MSSVNILKSRVRGLITKLSANGTWSRSALSRLRMAYGKEMMDVRNVWDVVAFEEFTRVNGQACNEDNAILAAMSMYAVHKGGGASPHVDGVGFGQALSRLTYEGASNYDAVCRRFTTLIGATTLAGFKASARSLLCMLANEGIKFDYVKFAEDLYWYQVDSVRKKIILRWGSEFYRA